MNKKVAVVSLFSGAGGLDMGFIKEGFHIDVAIELDSIACETYRANHPNTTVINYDVTTLTGETIRELIQNKPIIILGGPPCQSWSIMKSEKDGIGGKRGFDDERGHMILEYVRLCQELQPFAIVFENVENLVTEHESSFKQFRNLLEKSTGLALDYRVLNALDFGTGQSRKRCILVGVKRGIPNPFDFLQRINGPKTLQEALQNVPPSEFFRFKKEDAEVMEMIGEGQCWNVLPPQLAYQKMGKHYRGVCKKCKTKFQGRNSCPKCGSKDIANQKGVLTSYYRRLSWNKYAPTICTVRTTKAWGTLAHPTEQRGLSIREAARLQSFPDEYLFYGNIFEQIRQIGNAVPCNMGQAIAKALKQSFEKMNDALSKKILKKIINQPKYHKLLESEKNFVRGVIKKAKSNQGFSVEERKLLKEIYRKIECSSIK
ncbi:DNA cytosine methyltransferase [Calidifontibacillus erzurumensis]|uniref:DNA cytosine methyltransferase n=1 Tax=Calidifontibacillus erzurumensis TaxID=2741433 RepID=UPI0035B54381